MLTLWSHGACSAFELLVAQFGRLVFALVACKLPRSGDALAVLGATPERATLMCGNRVAWRVWRLQVLVTYVKRTVLLCDRTVAWHAWCLWHVGDNHLYMWCFCAGNGMAWRM